ncbi:hypothetical protein RHO12_06525 [Orbus sturtevantii]|uniref:hypothetical protein n=1 Tax=Orbus sturtevantii TaxID=3074109 RepID=UPI00370D481E
MASDLKTNVENKQGDIDKQLKNTLELLAKMQNTSGQILGETNKTSKQFGDAQNKITALNKLLTSPKIPNAIGYLEKFAASLNKLKDREVELIKSNDKNDAQFNKALHSLASLDDLVPLLSKQSQSNFSYLSSKNQLDKDTLTKKLNFYQKITSSGTKELGKHISQDSDVYKSVAATSDITAAAANFMPDFLYNNTDLGIKKQKLISELEITLADLEVRRRKGFESTKKLNDLEIKATEKFNNEVYQLEQQKLKFQLSSGTIATAQLAAISTKYLSAEHNITKSLSAMSKAFDLSNNIVPSMNDGLKGFDEKRAQLESIHQQKQLEYAKNAKKYSGLAGLWQYESKLEDKQYGRDVRDVNSEKDVYQYDQMSSLFSGYAGIAGDAFGKNNLASTVLGDVSKGFSIAGQLTSGSNRLDQINDQKDDLQKKYNDDLLYQKEALEQKQINQQQYADNVTAIEQDMNDKLSALNQEHTMTSIDMFSTMAGGIADLLKQTAGESSAAYKVMFLASKASALAQAVVNTEVAATKALELGGTFGTIMSGVVRGMGYASIGIIAAQSISGMAHSGIDSIPSEGTWLLDKGERVVDARTNADLKNFLQSSNQSQSGFSVNVPVSISGGDVSEEDGKQLGSMIKQSVMSIIQEQQRPGGVLNRY